MVYYSEEYTYTRTYIVYEYASCRTTVNMIPIAKNQNWSVHHMRYVTNVVLLYGPTLM